MSRSVGRRLSLGPVFAYEWTRSSRRRQSYALRSSFVLFLLMGLAYVWMNTSFSPAKGNIRLMAELGEWFFQAVIGTQLTLVLPAGAPAGDGRGDLPRPGPRYADAQAHDGPGRFRKPCWASLRRRG